MQKQELSTLFSRHSGTTYLCELFIVTPIFSQGEFVDTGTVNLPFTKLMSSRPVDWILYCAT